MSDQPAAPPTPTQRLAALGEVVACSGFPTQLAAAGILAGAGHPIRVGVMTSRYLFALSVIDTALLLTLIFLLIWLRGQHPSSIFLARWRPSRDLLLGIALIPVIFGVVVGLLSLIKYRFPAFYGGDHNPLEALIRTRSDVALFAVIGVIAGGFREELQRAFVLRRFDHYLGGAPLGLFLFSIIFGLGHVVQGWDAALVTAILGIFWGIVFLRRGSVVAPVVSHASFDVIEVLRYYLYGS